MDGETKVRLRVLGELAATRDGAAVDLGGRRQRAVLAALVISHGEAVPAERLADCVWGDRQPADPPGAVQAYVSHLRRALQPEARARRRDGVIAREAAGYVLRLTPDAVDAWCFERAVTSAAGLAPAEALRTLDDSLRLWRGPAYAEYVGEPWVEAEALRLTELRAVARERRLEARLRLGDAAIAIGELEALVAEDPLREERWALLVRALYQAHRQAGALEALRRARETLAEELGVDPGPALRTLEAEVLAQSPTLDGPAPPPRAEPHAEVVSPGPPASTDLIDRAREVTSLQEAVDGLATGRAGCVLVEGPAGIGKSRLLLEAMRLASSADVRVLSARGTQLERSFGFGAVRQLFEACTGDLASREVLLGGAASAARPVFEEVVGDEAVDNGSFAVLHGLYWLTVNLAAQGPVMICVDDIQWCDTASLRYLAYLLKRSEGLPVLLVLALRTGEDHPDDALLADLALDPSVTALRPAPLSVEAAATLVHERLGMGADSFVETCHRMTSGNPLLLRQLLRALAEEGVRPDVSHVDTVRAVGSRAVSALVTLRLRRMPPTVTAAARAVAVLGDAAGLPTVAALAQQPEDDVAAALDVLSRSEILKDGPQLSFVHPLVRDAIYDDLPAGERALHHERAARILQEHGAAAEQVAAHLLRAPRRGSAATVQVLRSAAGTAMSRGASEATVGLLRRALEEPVSPGDRAPLLLELGRVETHVDGPSGVVHLTDAYSALDDPHERALLAMDIARTHVFVSPPGVATEYARAAATALPEGFDDERQGLLALQRVTGFMHGLPPDSYRAGPVPDVVGDGDGARMLAATLSYELLRDGRDRAGAARLARFSLEGDRLLAVDNGLLWIVAANVLLLADDEIGDFWDRALARAHATGGLFAALSVNLWRGFTQWRRGQLEDALQSLADAVEQQRAWGLSSATSTYAAAFTLGVLTDLGDLDAATESLEADRSLPWVGEGGRLLREAAARLQLEQGHPAEALAELSAGVEPTSVVNPAWTAWRGLTARALAGLGRGNEAIALAQEEVDLLRVWGARTALGPALRLLGELLHGADGTAYLREAVEVLSGTSAVLEEARAQLALGRSPETSSPEAVRLLSAALDTARACGARALVRDTLSALGQRGESCSEVDGEQTRVTSRQRRVIDLAATGLDVHEVAQRLFLTPGTVRAVLEAAGGIR